MLPFDHSYDLFELRATNPERPPNWRWQRASIIFTSKAQGGFLGEEQLVCDTIEFFRYRKRSASYDNMCANYPVIFEVNRLVSGISPSRWLIEALILGDATPEVIADKIGWGTDQFWIDVIKAYESLCFDVRSRIKSDLYVLTNIVGMPDGTIGSSEERVWKALSWIGMRRKVGTALLEAYINIDSMPDATRKWFEKFVDNQITRKAARSLLRFDPLGNKNMIEFLRNYSDMRKLDLQQEAAGRENTLSDTNQQQKRLLDGLTLSTAKITQVANSHIEPRAHAIINQEIESNIQAQLAAASNKLTTEGNKQ